jgi:hypothetical protein
VVAVNAATPARTSSDNVTSRVTAAFNPPANSLLLAFPTANGSGATPVFTMSNNGAATAWTEQVLRGESDSPTFTGGVAAYTTFLSAARTGMTVTVTIPVAQMMSLKVYVLTSVNSTSPVGGVAEGNHTANGFTTTGFTVNAASSLGVFAASYFSGSNALAAPTSSDTTFDAFGVGVAYAGGSGYKTLGAAGTSATFNVDAEGAGIPKNWHWISLEIRDSSAPNLGAAPPRPHPTSRLRPLLVR